MTMLYIVIGIIVLIIIVVVFYYNSLVKKQNHAEEAWADIDVQLKRRYDLIPNLVNTVKGYAEHESQTLQNVTEARTAAINAGGMKQQAQAENALTDALKSVFAVSESYPDLKASQNFAELQRELSDTENKLQSARRFYNNQVMALQNALEGFPGNVLGKPLGITTREFFEIAEDSAAREPVAVSF